MPAPGTMATPVMLGANERLRQMLLDGVQFPRRLGHLNEFAQLVETIARNPYLNGENIRSTARSAFRPGDGAARHGTKTCTTSTDGGRHDRGSRRALGTVTGGGSGIGLACARRLAEDGATVTICGRTESRLREAADEFGMNWIACDVTDESQVRRAVDAATDAADGLHITVANAGSSLAVGPLVMTDLQAWNATLALNLTGTFVTIKHAAPVIGRSGGGAIVAMSSIAGALTHRNLGVYCITKAGIEMMVRNAADELGEFGVRVNAIRPGLVPTDASSALLDDVATYDDYLAQMPVRRTGEPDEIAAAVRYLVGDEATWVTGQVLGIDGGHTLRRGPNLALLASRFDASFRELMTGVGDAS